MSGFILYSLVLFNSSPLHLCNQIQLRLLLLFSVLLQSLKVLTIKNFLLIYFSLSTSSPHSHRTQHSFLQTKQMMKGFFGLSIPVTVPCLYQWTIIVFVIASNRTQNSAFFSTNETDDERIIWFVQSLYRVYVPS